MIKYIKIKLSYCDRDVRRTALEVEKTDSELKNPTSEVDGRGEEYTKQRGNDGKDKSKAKNRKKLI